jgi:hypothetical protein
MVSTFLDRSGASGLQIEAPVATHFPGADFILKITAGSEPPHQARKSKRLLQRIPPLL